MEYNGKPWDEYIISEDKISREQHCVPKCVNAVEPERDCLSIDLETSLQNLELKTQNRSRRSQSARPSFSTDHLSRDTRNFIPQSRRQIVRRVMSDLQANVQNKEFSTQDFINELVDRVITEVANEMNIDDYDDQYVYPKEEQTSILSQHSYEKKSDSITANRIDDQYVYPKEERTSIPSQHSYEEKSESITANRIDDQDVYPKVERTSIPSQHSYEEKSESIIGNHIYDDTSEFVPEQNQNYDIPPQPKEKSDTMEEEPNFPLFSDTIDPENEAPPDRPPSFLERLQDNYWQSKSGDEVSQGRKLLQSPTFWCIIFSILFVILLIYAAIILGAFLALSICHPGTCPPIWSNSFFWRLFVTQTQEPLRVVY